LIKLLGSKTYHNIESLLVAVHELISLELYKTEDILRFSGLKSHLINFNEIIEILENNINDDITYVKSEIEKVKIMNQFKKVNNEQSNKEESSEEIEL
jgi:hypothetical protein